MASELKTTTTPRSRIERIRLISPLACVLVVTLRLFIGWQFLYEGLWKLDKVGSESPWTAEGYLGNAQGPFRAQFRAMTGDPDGLGWLDYDNVANRWDRFEERFADHYDLDDGQRSRLTQIINGSEAFTAPVAKLPDNVDLFEKGNRESWARKIQAVASYNGKEIRVDADEPLLPSEIAYMKALAPHFDRDPNGYYLYTPEEGTPKKFTDVREFLATLEDDERPSLATELEWFRAVERLETLQSRNLGYKRRLAAALKGDPDRIGVVGRLQENGSRYVPEMGTINAEKQSAEQVIIRYGEQQVYRKLLEEYEDLITSTDLQFKKDHAAALIGKVRAKKNEVIGPIEQLNDELIAEATSILRPEQFNSGALPAEPGPLQFASDAAMWGLLVLGTLLLIGFCTPLAAIAGAVMLLNFYLVWPPWPGVIDAPGPEHAFIVNKNLIECVALLAIAAMPTGRWFGVDGILAWLFAKATSKTAVTSS